MIKKCLLRHIAGAWLVAGLFGGSAALGGDDDRCDDEKVELDSLKGELRPGGNGWTLDVKFKVKAEGRPPAGPLELLVQVRECGQFLPDETGRPLTFVVPLEQPTDCDDDELEFKSRVAFELPAEAIRCPDRLRIVGFVTLRGSDQALDRKEKSVKLRGCDGDGGGRGVQVNVWVGG